MTIRKKKGIKILNPVGQEGMKMKKEEEVGEFLLLF